MRRGAVDDDHRRRLQTHRAQPLAQGRQEQCAGGTAHEHEGGALQTAPGAVLLHGRLDRFYGVVRERLERLAARLARAVAVRWPFVGDDVDRGRRIAEELREVFRGLALAAEDEGPDADLLLGRLLDPPLRCGRELRERDEFVGVPGHRRHERRRLVILQGVGARREKPRGALQGAALGEALVDRIIEVVEVHRRGGGGGLPWGRASYAPLVGCGS
mmetsp:Transcript_12011/g.34312  ORF Transcript_12011/g.34312 Transcript_12011/m.34312 type:complete len:216 (-) Transcript_12011:7-654(-)